MKTVIILATLNVLAISLSQGQDVRVSFDKSAVARPQKVSLTDGVKPPQETTEAPPPKIHRIVSPSTTAEPPKENLPPPVIQVASPTEKVPPPVVVDTPRPPAPPREVEAPRPTPPPPVVVDTPRAPEPPRVVDAPKAELPPERATPAPAPAPVPTPAPAPAHKADTRPRVAETPETFEAPVCRTQSACHLSQGHVIEHSAPYVVSTHRVNVCQDRRMAYTSCGHAYYYDVAVVTYVDVYSNGQTHTYTRTVNY